MMCSYWLMGFRVFAVMKGKLLSGDYKDKVQF